jgi:hypothetical protein
VPKILLYAPKIIFLLLIVVVLGSDGHTEGVRLGRHREWPDWFGVGCAGSGRDGCLKRFEKWSGRSSGLVRVAD